MATTRGGGRGVEVAAITTRDTRGEVGVGNSHETTEGEATIIMKVAMEGEAEVVQTIARANMSRILSALKKMPSNAKSKTSCNSSLQRPQRKILKKLRSRKMTCRRFV